MTETRLNKIIAYAFYSLFFLVPLILTPWNFELFEYNKMMLTYVLTAVIITAWVIKAIGSPKINFVRTPLDLPLLLFLGSQILATVFSWDRHISVFGYYSRFNGGLLSSASFLLLYFALTNNFPRSKIRTLLKVTLISGLLVSAYGILERLGIDKDIWVQDVQNRVFSTLGQPNWLAAYLAVLLPVSLALSIVRPFRKGLPYTFASMIFFCVLIFSKSRSGFIAFTLSAFIFWMIQFVIYRRKIIRQFLVHNLLLIIIIFIFGAPFAQLNRFTLPELTKPQEQYFPREVQPPNGASIIDIGITESGTIRKYVWQAAVNAFKNYPLTGTGVETFAFSFYKFRPQEHNLTSEWDFLYNKAHNEYLNYAATSGILGLTSYLGFMLAVVYTSVKNLRTIKKEQAILPAGLLAGWLSIAITNFFGFSVVIIQIFFFCIPGLLFLATAKPETAKEAAWEMSGGRKTAGLAVSLLFLTIIFSLGRMWLADLYYARAHNQTRSEEYAASYSNLLTAIKLNPREPLYFDELSFPTAQLALGLSLDGQATVAAGFIRDAQMYSNKAIAASPRNVNFWKTRTRVFYGLSQTDESLIYPAISALEKAKELSPNDPKIRYNLALMYDQLGKAEDAYRELEDTIRMKIDYRDAYLAQAIFYNRDGNKEKAAAAANFIINRLNPEDEEAKQVLSEIK
ncbi:MAG: hypothetical protein UV73_C0018G0014 [Candidatus Gottesmanbacteria bacterium GW2011_GWA2_43_14]|uniref:O-antigen ligase-related domain-containing protein n=1 Tax=Candidatus Gottesmanbacteria bacterium GW2011_GWA2_43_14 TaxID=1618443 RepID=A0A0G1FJW2_9BACT|nr:MAG: hypothetical protein UV73_C0018G0014 [Candidatus Gottesmanbacteria bacterium GW2011_GWA2_43_14]